MSSIVLLAPPLRAAPVDLDSDGKVKLSADFRLRLEADFDSQTASGSERADRDRARVRARVGLRFLPKKGVELGLRLRSGAVESQQSPHITVIDFDGNDTGSADFNFDKWYFKLSGERGWAWVGRQNLPFWQQFETVFDTDATPAGLAAGSAWDLEAGKLTVSGGYFSMPVGLEAFSGNLAGAQAAYSRDGEGAGFTIAASLLSFDADPNDPDAALLLNGNGFRDYEIWVGNLQYRTSRGDLPLTFGADFMHNAEGYSATDPDPFTAANFDQTDGWLAFGRVGSLKKKGDWLGGYHYARIETLAVNSSYNMDDWARWGSRGQGRVTNFRGHELRVAYAFSSVANVVARLFLVEALTTVEDGNRLRVDFNYKF